MKTIALVALLAAAPVALRAVQEPREVTSPARQSQKVTPFLMFEGRAEEAMRLYVSLFDGAEIVSLERYGPGESGTEGSVKLATLTLAGQELMCIDSSVDHAFTFTPALSLFVTCGSEAELDELFAELSEDGEVFMPPGDHGFSRKFTWLADRFGVSWQLNLPSD